MKFQTDVPILETLEWNSQMMKEMLHDMLWEEATRKLGVDTADTLWETYDPTIEISEDRFIVSVGEEDICHCCGVGNETLSPCPGCGELLCQGCEDFLHICETE